MDLSRPPGSSELHASDPGRATVSVVPGLALDTHDPRARARAPGGDPSSDLERTDTVGRKPVHLNIVVGNLPHQPSRLHPLSAKITRVSCRQRLAVVLAVPRSTQLFEGLIDLRMRIRHRNRRAVCGKTIANTVTTNGA
ncbi:hypothetical protein Ahu01nite_094470 [Winogradskya humida]|uniref:Uncharacterized protein n=1 Tax=Winogradskya humida TaxID=113566 RepID=A0ABQ4A676_9ACTN|nr:hypothetical protein Ahu01nite_094470 [Actinoplanes humidus]